MIFGISTPYFGYLESLSAVINRTPIGAYAKALVFCAGPVLLPRATPRHVHLDLAPPASKLFVEPYKTSYQ